MSVVDAALILSWFAIVVLAFAMAGILRQVNALKEGRGGGELGVRTGSRVSLPFSAGDRTRVLLFAAPDCASCHEILERLPGILDEVDGFEMNVVMRTGSDVLDVDPRARVIVDADLFTDLHVRLVPVAAAVDGSGIVLRTEPVGSWERFAEFLHRLPRPVTPASVTDGGER